MAIGTPVETDTGDGWMMLFSGDRTSCIGLNAGERIDRVDFLPWPLACALAPPTGTAVVDLPTLADCAAWDSMDFDSICWVCDCEVQADLGAGLAKEAATTAGVVVAAGAHTGGRVSLEACWASLGTSGAFRSSEVACHLRLALPGAVTVGATVAPSALGVASSEPSFGGGGAIDVWMSVGCFSLDGEGTGPAAAAATLAKSAAAVVGGGMIVRVALECGGVRCPLASGAEEEEGWPELKEDLSPSKPNSEPPSGGGTGRAEEAAAAAAKEEDEDEEEEGGATAASSDGVV